MVGQLVFQQSKSEVHISGTIVIIQEWMERHDCDTQRHKRNELSNFHRNSQKKPSPSFGHDVTNQSILQRNPKKNN